MGKSVNPNLKETVTPNKTSELTKQPKYQQHQIDTLV